MNEFLGLISTVLAICGVVFNNRLLRCCFLFWLVSNAITAIVHLDLRIWSLFARDVIFFGLAIEGWFRWKKKPI